MVDIYCLCDKEKGPTKMEERISNEYVCPNCRNRIGVGKRERKTGEDA